MKCDVDIMKDLYGNIILSGGTSMNPLINTLLEKEMILLAPPTTNTNVIASPEWKLSLDWWVCIVVTRLGASKVPAVSNTAADAVRERRPDDDRRNGGA